MATLSKSVTVRLALTVSRSPTRRSTSRVPICSQCVATGSMEDAIHIPAVAAKRPRRWGYASASLRDEDACPAAGPRRPMRWSLVEPNVVQVEHTKQRMNLEILNRPAGGGVVVLNVDDDTGRIIVNSLLRQSVESRPFFDRPRFLCVVEQLIKLRIFIMEHVEAGLRMKGDAEYLIECRSARPSARIQVCFHLDIRGEPVGRHLF